MRWVLKVICRKWPDPLAGKNFMHSIALADVIQQEKKLTQAVLQITQMLGMYHAELARVLRLNCADIGELAEARKVIEKSSQAWLQAQKFITLYERLFDYCAGDETCMCHWLRKHRVDINGAPLYVMVDELRIDDVLELFC